MNRISATLIVLAATTASVSCADNTPAGLDAPSLPAADVADVAPMSGKATLWEKGNIPTLTRNVNNSDGPDFIANLES